jgi:hypothetical protein
LTIKELPAINWIALHQDNDMTQLSRTGKICKRAEKVFENLRDQVIDEFGLSDDFLAIHRANVAIELMKCEMLQTGDRTLIFHIQMEEKFVSDLLKPIGNNSNLYDAMVWIKRQQISFDENKISTFWFMKYMDHLMKLVKKNKNPEKINVRK